MRRVLRRTGWALAAAGGIGIAGPAAAQSPVMQIIGPSGHVVEQTGEVLLMTEGQARLEEGHVELGLLADPMLFSYGLGAHVQQGATLTLEVRGFVPTEAARDQALKVARAQTSLHVIDRLKIQPNLATRCSIDKPENIQRAAKELLEDAFPEHGRGMDVRCDARGRVTVAGRVASFEDRLLVSRKLRQVSGCSCVANQLEVASVAAESRPAKTSDTLVISESPPVMAKPAIRKWEPSAPPVPVRPVAAPSHPESNLTSLPIPPVYPEPIALPPAPPVPARPLTVPAPKPSDAPILVMPRAYQEPLAPPPAPVPVVKPLPAPPPAPVPAVKPLPAPPPAPVSIVKPLPEPPPAPKRSVPPPIDVPPPPVKTELPRPSSSIDKDRPYGSGTPGAAALDLPPVEHPKPLSAVKLPEMVSVPVGHAPQPLPLPPVPPLPPRPAVSPLPKAPAVEKHDRGGSEESYVTEGTITLDDGSSRGVVREARAGSYVSEGTITLDNDPPSAKPAGWGAKASSFPRKPAEGTLTLTPPPMPPSRPATAPVTLSAPPAPTPPPRPTVPAAVRLKERIQGICGPAYEVKVTPRGKNYLQLDITGPVAGEEKRIMQRIKPVLESEEFRGFELNVDVITPLK